MVGSGLPGGDGCTHTGMVRRGKIQKDTLCIPIPNHDLWKSLEGTWDFGASLQSKIGNISASDSDEYHVAVISMSFRFVCAGWSSASEGRCCGSGWWGSHRHQAQTFGGSGGWQLVMSGDMSLVSASDWRWHQNLRIIKLVEYWGNHSSPSWKSLSWFSSRPVWWKPDTLTNGEVIGWWINGGTYPRTWRIKTEWPVWRFRKDGLLSRFFTNTTPLKKVLHRQSDYPLLYLYKKMLRQHVQQLAQHPFGEWKWWHDICISFFFLYTDLCPKMRKRCPYFEVELEDIPCLGVIFAKSCIRNKALRVGGWNS